MSWAMLVKTAWRFIFIPALTRECLGQVWNRPYLRDLHLECWPEFDITRLVTGFCYSCNTYRGGKEGQSDVVGAR